MAYRNLENSKSLTKFNKLELDLMRTKLKDYENVL